MCVSGLRDISMYFLCTIVCVQHLGEAGTGDQDCNLAIYAVHMLADVVKQGGSRPSSTHMHVGERLLARTQSSIQGYGCEYRHIIYICIRYRGYATNVEHILLYRYTDLHTCVREGEGV